MLSFLIPEHRPFACPWAGNFHPWSESGGRDASADPTRPQSMRCCRQRSHPFSKWQVRGQDDRPCLVAFGNHLEKQISLVALQWQIADLIDNQHASFSYFNPRTFRLLIPFALIHAGTGREMRYISRHMLNIRKSMWFGINNVDICQRLRSIYAKEKTYQPENWKSNSICWGKWLDCQSSGKVCAFFWDIEMPTQRQGVSLWKIL